MMRRGRPAIENKVPVRALGLRASVNDASLLDAAARLERRDRNTFCLLASLDAARRVFAAHGVREEDVLAEHLPAGLATRNAPRYQPVRPQNGESASAIVMRDRGRL